MNFPRILLIASEPYRSDSTARYLSTFFGGWDEEKIAQFYTVDTLPVEGFCRKYYRITDMEMIRSLLQGRKAIGRRVELGEEAPAERKKKKRFFSFFKSFNDHPTMLLFRSLLWRRRWDTEDFRRFVDEFDPELLFFPMGRNLYDAEIALAIAERRGIPLVTFLPDDSYYRYRAKLWPFARLYRRRLKRLLLCLFSSSLSIFSSCDKMKEQYESDFGVPLSTVHFSSAITTDGEEARDPYRFAFLGSPGYGRWRSLLLLGETLQKISPDYYIDVYAKPHDNEKYEKALAACPAIRLHQAVPYHEVVRVMKSSRFVLHIEDFQEKNKKVTRYSLSTKISDCLASGACPVAFGPAEVGSIDYLQKCGGAFVCTDEASLLQELSYLLGHPEVEKEIRERARIEAEKHCSPQKNPESFAALCQRVVSKK